MKEVRLSADTNQEVIVQHTPNESVENANSPKVRNFDKITTAKLAEKFGIGTGEFTKLLADNGYVELKGNHAFLTDKGREMGGEVKKGKLGYFIVWSVNMKIALDDKQSLADRLLSLFRA